MKDVFNLDSPTLGIFRRKFGEEWVIAYVTLWIIDLNENAQVKNKMNDANIEFIAKRIYYTYSLTVADLTFFFRNVKEGVYGSFYENLSSEKIMEWLRKYFDLRCEYAQMQTQSGHDSFSKKTNLSESEKTNLSQNLNNIFKGVGETNIDHSKKGMGLGSRKKGVINANLIKKISETPTKELKQYLLENDSSKKTFDEFIYKLIETEIDNRNKP